MKKLFLLPLFALVIAGCSVDKKAPAYSLPESFTNIPVEYRESMSDRFNALADVMKDKLLMWIDSADIPYITDEQWNFFIETEGEFFATPLVAKIYYNDDSNTINFISEVTSEEVDNVKPKSRFYYDPLISDYKAEVESNGWAERNYIWAFLTQTSVYEREYYDYGSNYDDIYRRVKLHIGDKDLDKKVDFKTKYEKYKFPEVYVKKENKDMASKKIKP